MKDASFLAALRQGSIRIHTFVKLELDSGDVRIWDGVGTSPSFNSETYSGVGTLGKVDFGEDVISQMARPFTLTLSGAYEGADGTINAVDGFADAVGLTLRETPLQNRVISVSVALTDENATTVLHTALDQVKGRIDTVDVDEDDQGNKSLIVNVEDATLLRGRRTPRNYSISTQQEDYPNSTYLSKVALLRTQPVIVGGNQ